MKQEKLDWFEKNWSSGKTGRKAASHGREWKLTNNIWDEPYEGCTPGSFSDYKSWKRYRKTQYRVKENHQEKKRKPACREHWRTANNPFHGYFYKFSRYRYRGSRYSQDEIDIALSFMGSLIPGDYIKMYPSYDEPETIMYRVVNVWYKDWSNESSLYVKCQQMGRIRALGDDFYYSTEYQGGEGIYSIHYFLGKSDGFHKTKYYL